MELKNDLEVKIFEWKDKIAKYEEMIDEHYYEVKIIKNYISYCNDQIKLLEKKLEVL